MEEQDILNDDPQNILDSAEKTVDLNDQGSIKSNAKQDASIEQPGEDLLIEPDYDSFINGGDFGRIQRGTTLPIDRTKYEPYMDTVRLEEGIEGLNKIRATNQPLGERIFNFADQVIMGEIIGGTISGFGAIFETPASVVDEIIGGNADFKNMLTEFGDAITQASKDRAPQYRLNPGMAWDVGDPGWWFENGVSVASTLSLLIPAWGTTKLVGTIGKYLGIVGKLSKKTNELLKVAGMATVMRNGENLKESLQVTEQVYKDTEKIFQDSETFDKWLETDIGQEYIADRSEVGKVPEGGDAAEWIAAKAGWRTYAVNSANIVFDLIQASAFMKTNYFTRTNAVKSKAIKAAVAKETAELAGKTAVKTEAGRLTKLANMAPSAVATASVLGEGVEEAINFVGSTAGQSYASSLLQGNDVGIFKGTIDAIGKSYDDPHLYESAFWGVLGGAAFEGAGHIYQAATEKEGRSADAMKIAEIDNRKATLVKFSKDTADIIEKFDKGEISKEQADNALITAKESLTFDIGYNAAAAGNIDLLLESIDSGALLKHVEANSSNKAQVVEQLDNIKQDILTIERQYNKAVNKYVHPDINAASRQGLIKAYTHNAANVINRQRHANRHYAEAQNALNDNPDFQQMIADGQQPLASLKLSVLEVLQKLPQFEGNAKKEIEKEMKILGETKPSTAGISSEDVIQSLTNYYIHEFLKRDSQAYITKATEEKFVNSFDKAVEEVIKQSKTNAEKTELDKFKATTDKTLEGRSLKEQEEILTKAMKRQKNKDRNSYLNKKLGEVKNQIRDEEATNPNPVKETDAVPITSAPTVASEMGLDDKEFEALKKNLNKVATQDDNDAKSKYLQLLREELASTDKTKTAARTFLQESIDLLEASTINKRITTKINKSGDRITIGDIVLFEGNEVTVLDIGTSHKGDAIAHIKAAKNILSVKLDSLSPKPTKAADSVVAKIEELRRFESISALMHGFSDEFTPAEIGFVEFVSNIEGLLTTIVVTNNSKNVKEPFSVTKTIHGNEITLNKYALQQYIENGGSFGKALTHEMVHVYLSKYGLYAINTRNVKGFPVTKSLDSVLNDIHKEFQTAIKNNEQGKGENLDPELKALIYQIGGGEEMLANLISSDEYYTLFMSMHGAKTMLSNALDSFPELREVIKARNAALAGEGFKNILATNTAIGLAAQYDINLEIIEGTGKDGKIILKDVKKFIKDNNIKLPTELVADGVVSNTEAVDGNNIYVPFISDGVIDGVVNATVYNARMEERFGNGAIFVTQEELETAVKKILSFETNTGTPIVLRKTEMGIEVLADDVRIGWINRLKGLSEMLAFANKVDKMSFEELQAAYNTVNFGKQSLIDWKLKSITEEGYKAPKPFSTAISMLESQIKSVEAIEVQFALSGKNELNTSVIRKTSGAFAKGDQINLTEFQSDISEVFFVPPNSPNIVLQSSQNSAKKFVRNPNATQYYNFDIVYEPGTIYMMARGANTNPSDPQSFIPVPVRVGNIPDSEIDPIIDKIARLVQLSQDGRNMLNDPDVIAIKEELQYIINVERSDKNSVNYFTVTSDEIRYSYYNEKTGENEHVHIAYKSKFDSKPTLYITEEKFAKNKIFNLFGKQKKFVSAKNKNEFRDILRKTLKRKRANVNYKMLESGDKFRDDKTYLEWMLGQDQLLTTDLAPIKTPSGENLKDAKGNNVPAINSRVSASNVDSHLVITLDTSFGSKPSTVTTDEKVAKIDNKETLELLPKKKTTGNEPLKLFKKVQSGDETKTKIDPEAAQRAWNRMFGNNVPLDMNIVGMIAEQGELAWGIFENAMVKISKSAIAGTEYHEAFHAAFWLYLTPQQRDSIINEAKKEYGDLSRITLEEIIADEFMDYMMTDGVKTPKRANTMSFFKRIWKFIKELFIGQSGSYTERIFRNISDGKYNYAPDARLVAYAKGIKRTKLVEGMNRNQQQEVVNTITKLVIDSINEYSASISIADLYKDTNIQQTVKQQLERYRDYIKEQGREGRLDFVLENFDILYQYGIDNIKRQFNITEDDTVDADDYLEKEWDDTKSFTTSQSDTTTAKIKKLIMTTPSDVAGEYLGLATFLDFNKVYPYIQRIMLNSTSMNEMIARLETFAAFEPALFNIAEKLRVDDNLASAWYSNFKKQFIARDYVKAQEDSLTVDESNKNTSFFAISNEWVDNLYRYQESGIDALELERTFGDLTRAALLRNEVDQTALKSVLDTIGIHITDRQFELMFSSMFIGEGKQYASSIDLYNNVIEPLISGTINDIKANTEEFKLESYGRYNKLAEIISYIQLDKLESSSFNVNGDNVFNISVPTFLSSFFDLFNAATSPSTVLIDEAKTELLERLKEYIMDPAIASSNWLWGDENGEGIFYSKKDINDLTIEDLNLDYIKTFKMSLLDGLKDIDEREAQTYADMVDANWIITQASFYLTGSANTVKVPILIPSDSGNIYFIQSRRFEGVDSNGELIVGSALYNAIRNTVEQEIQRMISARDLIFKEVDGKFVAKEHKLGVSSDDPNFVDYTKLQKNFHYTKLDENGMPILIKDGKPTGRAFQFQRLRELNNMNIELNSGEYNVMRDGIYRGDKLNDSSKALVEIKIKEAIVDFAKVASAEHFNTLKEFKDLIDNIETNKTFGSLEQIAGEMALNHYISNVEQFNFFNGQESEFKSDADTNKRAKQIVSPGLSGSDKGIFRAAVIKDIELSSDIFESMATTVANQLSQNNNIEGEINLNNLRNGTPTNMLEQMTLNIVGGYLNTNIADGQGYMSLARAESILRSVGRWDKSYEILFNKLKDVKYKPTLDELNKVLQPFKGFYYSRRFDKYTNKMVSNQIKYSSVPLIPSLVYGTDLEKMYRWMKKNKLDEVFFESAEKVGTKHVLSVSDNNGKLSDEKLNQYSTNKGFEFREYFAEDWRLQLDIPDHIRDTKNKLGLQISKIILSNIDPNTVYNIGKEQLNGQELIDQYLDLIVTNIQESYANLVDELDIDENYKIKDIEGLQQLLDRQVENRNISDNYRDAIKTYVDQNGNVRFNLPLFASHLSNKWESILASMFTNNVTTQKIDGGSAVVFSSAFITDGQKYTEMTLEELMESEQTKNADKVGINWLDKKIDDRSLKMMEISRNGKIVQKAECLLPAWSKKFFIEVNGKFVLDDINNIPEELRTLIWYRIPYEGKHMTIVAECVGFLPTDANIIVLPREAITQSGEDFDVDKRFGVYRGFDVNEGLTGQQRYEMIDYNDPEDLHFERWLSTKHARAIKKEYLTGSEEALNYKKQIARFKTQLDNSVNALKKSKQLRRTLQDNVEATVAGIFGEGTEGTLADIIDSYAIIMEEANTRLSAINEIRAERNLPAEENVRLKNEFNEQLGIRNEAHASIKALNTLFREKLDEVNQDTSEDIEKTVIRLKRKKEILNNYIQKRDESVLREQREEFDNLPVSKKIGRTARNNRIFDTFVGVLLNPAHYTEVHSPSSFEDGIKAIREVNELTSGEVSEKIPTTLSAQLEFRKQNIAGRALKGMAADVNSFLSVAQVTRMYVRDDLAAISAYPKGTYKMSELIAKYGKDNVIEIGDKVVVRHTRYAWNQNGSYTNVDNQITTKHAGQLLPQILDIVKEGVPYNVNTYTFYMYINMINMGMPLRYASLLIRQPVLVDIVNHYFNTRSFGSNQTNNEISEIKQSYQKKLFEALSEAKQLPKNDLVKKLYGRMKGGFFYISKADNNSKKDFDTFLSDSIKEILGYDLSKIDTEAAFVYDELRDMIANEKRFNLDTKVGSLNKDDRASYIKWLRNQLIISEKFLKYKEGGEALRDMTVALNTDKRGAGPSLSVNLKLMHDIEKATYYHKYKSDGVFMGAEGARILIDTEDGTNPATVAIYPEFFKRQTEDGQAYPEFANTTAKSVYPSLNAFRLYANERAFSILSQEFIQYSNAFSKFTDTVHQKLGKSYNVELATKVNNFLTFYITKNLPYFNQIDTESLMGVDKTVSTEYDVNLSAANKLAIIKEKYGEQLFNDTHILNYLSPNTSGLLTRKRGIHTISFINTKTDEITDNTLIDSFKLLWSGQISAGSEFDPDVKDLAESLIQYNFVTYGFSMGIDSFGKLIPLEVFQDIGYDKYLYDLVDTMKNPNVLMDANIFDKFIRNNSNDASIVSVVNANKYKYWTPNSKGVIEIKESVAHRRDNNVGKDYVNVPIYITKNDKKISIGTRLFKLHETQNEVFTYIPVDRLGSSFFKELGDRSVIKNNRVLFSPEVYIALTDSIATNLNGKQLPKNEVPNSRYELMFRFANGFIGEGLGKYSYAGKIKATFGTFANTGNYTTGDLIMATGPTKSDGTLREIEDTILKDKFVGIYTNITRAIMNGATVMVASPFDEYGNKSADYNSNYFLGEYVIRKYLTGLVNDGTIAARIENGIVYYAKNEGVLTTISRKLTTDDDVEGNIKCDM